MNAERQKTVAFAVCGSFCTLGAACAAGCAAGGGGLAGAARHELCGGGHRHTVWQRRRLEGPAGGSGRP